MIVTHDAYMSRATNIAELEQFADRKRKRVLEYEKDSQLVEEERDDWWVMDFTLEELQQVKVRQTLAEAPGWRRTAVRRDIVYYIYDSSWTACSRSPRLRRF